MLTPGIDLVIRGKTGDGKMDLYLSPVEGDKYIMARRCMTTVNNGKWHNLTWVMDREGQMVLYMNGLEECSLDMTKHAGKTLSSIKDAGIGARADGKDGWIEAVFDDFRIYNRALNEDEVEGILEQYEGKF